MMNPTTQSVTKIETAVHIKRAIDDIYDFVTTPSNWPQWHPSSIAVTGDSTHSLEVGEQVAEDFCVVWRRGQVVWTVTGREAPFYWEIDGKIAGHDLGGTIQYQLAPHGEGTLFRREFAYPTPTFFFAAVNKLIGRRRVRYESELASLRLKSLLETGRVAGE